MSKCCCDDCVKTICPLPRIGSKRWGWAKTAGYDGVSDVYTSNICEYRFIQKVSCEVLKQDKATKRWDCYGRDLTFLDARTLAESRARRDWRRENGKT